MRRFNWHMLFLAAVVLAMAPRVLAMGTTGGHDINNPIRDYRATVVDKDGTKVEINRINIGGDVQIEGDMGRGTLRISFDNIQSVDFAADSHDYSTATVHLKNGETVALRVRNSLMIYGQTDIGVYQIRARDLQSIVFAG